MIPLTFTSFFIYCGIAWGANMLLNVLGIIKKISPRKLSFDQAIDYRKIYKGDRLLGESTTFLGLILCLTISILLYIFTFSYIWSVIPILVYFGHALGSFIKRRMHKKGGEFVPFVDHGDYMFLTGIIFLYANFITYDFFILSLLLTYVLHPIVCFMAYKLKWREHPY